MVVLHPRSRTAGVLVTILDIRAGVIAPRSIIVATLPEGDDAVTLHDDRVLKRQDAFPARPGRAWIALPHPLENGELANVAWVFDTR
jgi:hypothetical protein